MSMPAFPEMKDILSREEAINAILTSIAMEETALGHIMDAEGEKIQYAIKKIQADQCCADLQKLVDVNESAASMLDRLHDMQIILKSKLRLVLCALPHKHDEHHCVSPCPPEHDEHHCVPPCQAPGKPCKSVHSSVPDCEWFHHTALHLKNASDCENGVKLCPKCNSALILPSSGKKYKIEMKLELSSKTNCPISIEAEFRSGGNTFYSNRYACHMEKNRVHLAESFIWETPASRSKGVFTIWLLSPENLKVDNGIISIAEVPESGN